MTMVIVFQTSIESCGGDHGMSSKQEGVWPSSSKKERSMTSREEAVMAYLLKKRRSALPIPREGKDDHGHLPPFLSEELLR